MHGYLCSNLHCTRLKVASNYGHTHHQVTRHRISAESTLLAVLVLTPLDLTRVSYIHQEQTGLDVGLATALVGFVWEQPSTSPSK